MGVIVFTKILPKAGLVLEPPAALLAATAAGLAVTVYTGSHSVSASRVRHWPVLVLVSFFFFFDFVTFFSTCMCGVEQNW